MLRWKWTAASRRGTAHAQTGERRQDAYRVLTTKTEFLVAIACDGAGSASRGGSGAAIAARFLSGRAKDWLEVTPALPSPVIVELWINEARAVLSIAAANAGCLLSDFATTVVMAISNGSSTMTAHIGDGAIVGRRRGASIVEHYSWPESGEYAATTYFLTDSSPRLRVGVMHDLPMDRIALLTDGLERLALDFVTRVPHAGFFSSMFAPDMDAEPCGCDIRLSRKLAHFLDSDSVVSRTDDDKTLILAALA